jgi:hypothetical protein
MCENENKSEYGEGVIETLENAMDNFRKLIHKMKVEEE